MIGYIRVSMAREEMISPEIQKAAITTWAQRNNRRIIDWVPDLDRSGRNFRRKVMKAIERIEAREAAEIGVYRYDRWGRNAVESLANCKRVEMVGGQVESATEPFDVETAIGKYSRTNAFAIAEMQSDLISENWKAAIGSRIDRGIPGTGTPRFGYIRLGRIEDPLARVARFRFRTDPADPNGERYEPDYASGLADVHVEMFDRYLSDSGFMSIAKWLNARGIRNTRGKPWNSVTARNVLDSGFAAGLLRIHDSACRCSNPSDCPRRLYVPGVHDPIIDDDTWQTYLKARADRATQPPKARYPKYVLTSLIVCGHCDSTMKPGSGWKVGMQGYNYRCNLWSGGGDCTPAFPRRADAEAAVLEALEAWAADIDARAAVTQARVKARATAETDRERLTAALADHDAALQRLAVQRAVDGEKMPDGVYEAARDELLRARRETETALAGVQDTLEATAGDVRPILAGLLEGWETLPVQARRDMLRKLIRHVKAYRAGEDGGAVRFDVKPVWEACSCKRCRSGQEGKAGQAVVL
jgi:DNA invertase Pin-like site-specific DNA recombinase